MINSNCGIYAIHHIESGLRYIGSTVNRKVRFRTHLNLLRASAHHNIKLSSLWGKSSEKDFEFYMIEGVDDNDLLLTREQFWIDFFSSIENGLNILKAGEVPRFIESGQGKKVARKRKTIDTSSQDELAKKEIQSYVKRMAKKDARIMVKPRA